MVNSANHSERDAMENTSGQGRLAVIPEEIHGWNWGAFLLRWIWGIGNNVWIALLAFIPFVSFIMGIVLGIKGNEWAWRNKKWDSVEHFKRTQRTWAIAGGIVVVVTFVFVLLPAVIIPNVGRFISEREETEAIEKKTETEALPTATLGIRNVKICSDVKGDRDYTVQPDATFSRGDEVWLYFEIRGITSKKVDDGFEVWMKFTNLELYDPNNHIIEHLTNITELHETIEGTLNYGWFWAVYESTTDDAAGQYRWEVTVKDELSEAMGTGSATFTLR